MDLSRRNLLRGVSSAASRPIRPPGALSEPAFIDTCTSCGDCIATCPQNIIVSGSGGYPEVDFHRGECTFCDLCTDGCEVNALSNSVQPRWSLSLEVADKCLAAGKVVCQTCGDSCDVRAIRFPARVGVISTPNINANACTGCGACVASCPVQALTLRPVSSPGIAASGEPTHV